MLIRIPKIFYDDHVGRECPAPPILRETNRHYWIDTTHADYAELINDAEFYEDIQGFDKDAYCFCYAARAMLKAVRSYN
jgi:hypothetical protein